MPPRGLEKTARGGGVSIQEGNENDETVIETRKLTKDTCAISIIVFAL